MCVLTDTPIRFREPIVDAVGMYATRKTLTALTKSGHLMLENPDLMADPPRRAPLILGLGSFGQI